MLDQTGTPDMTTFKVLKSTRGLFSEIVQTALPQMKFVPTDVRGHSVKQLVQLPVALSLTKA